MIENESTRYLAHNQNAVVNPSYFGYTISGLKMSKAMFFLLFLIVILFLGLALDAFALGHIWHTIAAYSEMAIALLTFYVLSAKYLNSFFGKELLKTGAPFLK